MVTPRQSCAVLMLGGAGNIRFFSLRGIEQPQPYTNSHRVLKSPEYSEVWLLLAAARGSCFKFVDFGDTVPSRCPSVAKVKVT